jgi:hypothetical protein
MNDYELETFELIIELYDNNHFFVNQLIATQSLVLSPAQLLEELTSRVT